MAVGWSSFAVARRNNQFRDLGSFVTEAQRRIDKEIKVPAGGYLDWGGQFENLLAARDRLLPMTVASTETMVLQRDGDGWRIVHIHWSSRKKS